MLRFLSRSRSRSQSRRAARPSRSPGATAPAGIRLWLTALENRFTPATLHWLGTASSSWSAAGNWAENVAPVGGDTLVFDTTTPGFAATTTAFAPTNDLSGLTNLTVVINDASAAGDFAIGGTGFGLVTTAGVGIVSTVSAGTAATITANLTLGADTTVDVGLGSLTLGGVVGNAGGSFALTKVGAPAGTLTLNGANTYTGGTVLTSGTLSVGTNTALGTGLLTFNGGTLADAASFLHLANPFVVAAPSTIGGGGFFNLDGDGVLNATLSLDNTGFLALDGALSGPAGLSEIGFPGGTTLGGTAANTFAGGVNILFGGMTLQKTAGVNAVASPIALVGSFTSLTLNANDQLNGKVPVYLGQGSSFSTNGYSDSVSALTGLGGLNTGMSASAGLVVTGGGAQLLTGSVQGSGFLTYNGPGSLTLGGASASYSGTLTAAGGALVVAADFSGAAARVTGGTLAGTGVVKTITTTGGTLDFAGPGTGGTFTTASAATGSSLNGAIFRADLAPRIPSDQLALGANATLNLTGATLVLNPLAPTLAGTYQIITSPTGGLSGTFTGLPDGAAISVGSQTFRINYSPNAVTLTNVAAPAPTTLHWVGAVNSSWGTAGNWAENVVPASGDTLVFDTNTSGFAGTTAAFAPTNNLGSLTNLAVVINDGSTAGDFAIGGTGFGLVTTAGVGIESTVSAGTAATISANLTLGADTTVRVDLGSLTLGGVVGGAHALTKAGAPTGTLTLNGANIYSGGTVLAAGTLSVGTNTALGTGVLTLAGGTLANAKAFLHLANPFAVAAPSAIGGGSFFNLDGDGILNADLRLTNSGFLTLDGALSGPAGLIEDGFPGSTILSGTTANTFTGPTTIISGDLTLQKTAGVTALVSPVSVGGGGGSGSFPTLAWGSDLQLNGHVSVTLGADSTLNTNGYTDSVAALNGIGTVNTGSTASAGLTVTGGGAELVTGPVQGAGFLTYNGPGSLTLGGASASYSGTLTAAGGALVVAADFSGATARAQTGGKLGGTGIVKTFTSSGSAGTVSPAGAGVGGILTTAPGNTLTSHLSGQVFQADLSDVAPSDQLVVGAAAALDLTGATLKVTVLSSTFGDVYTIVSSATGGISGVFSGLTNGATVGAGGRLFQIHYTPNTVTLTDVQAISLNPAAPALPAGEVGIGYSQSITSTGGTGAVTLAVSGVTNTTGLIIGGSGTGTITISGTPTAAGTVTFTVSPTDALGSEAGTVYSLTVNPAVILSPTTLPAGEMGIGYSRSITASGGSGAVTLAVSGVSNPTGLTIGGDGTGIITISGTPTAAGTVTFTVSPTDALGAGTGTTYSFTVNPAVGLSPATLPTGEVGLGYSQSITSTGGTAPVKLVVSGVTNPTGLIIGGTGTGTITISGTPTKAGTVTFTVTPTDAAGTGAGTVYSVTVGPGVVLSPATLPAGDVGIGYARSITASGGTGAVTLALSGVSNPTGLTIGGDGTGTITISGTPTAAGTVTFTLTPTDALGTGAGTVYSFTINPAVALTPVTLPPGDVGLNYHHTITSTGGTGVVTLAVSGVSNPTGLTIGGSGTRTITISGTPTAAGTVTFTVTPTDALGTGTGTVYSFTVNPAVVLSPTTLPAGEVGLGYSQSITSSGGSGTVALAVSGIKNTTGLTIGGTGTGTITVSGTPTATGTVTFTVTPTDDAGTGAGTVYTFTVNPAVTLSPATLPAGDVGIGYARSITARGGSGAVTLALSGVSNPTGLTIGGDGTGTITISGTPTAAGTVTFTLTPTDAFGTGAAKVYSFTVSPPLVLGSGSLPDGEVGIDYSQSITTDGGSGATTLALSGVSNPTGLTIGGDGTGAITISGTPTAAGTVTFTVTPTDTAGTGAGTTYSFTVNPAVSLSPATLPAGDVGIGYARSITASGGTGAISLAVSGVSNPTGLIIGGDGTGTITISGTPTAAGTVTFTLTPTDDIGAGVGTVYTFTVNPAVTLSPTTLTAGEVGLGYSQLINPTGGTGTVTLAVSGVTNTTGLIIGGNGTGRIFVSGVPNAAGTVSFTVTPTDAAGTGAGTAYSFTVNPSVTLSPTTLPAGDVGTSYSQSISSTGGTGAVTLALSGVSNPTGLTIGGTGTGTITISGTPTAAGTVTFTLTPTDAAGTRPGTVYSFTVNPAVAVGPVGLPPGDVGTSYNRSITSTGGTGAVTLAVSGVSNPTGLIIDGNGTGTITISGTPTAAGTVTFTVTPTDAFGTGAAKVYSFAVNPAAVVAPASLPNGEVGLGYSQSITSSGGSAPVSLSVSGVTNPTGLTIGGTGTGTITISGTPTAAGTVTFTLTPADTAGIGTETTYSFTVTPAVTLFPTNLLPAEVGFGFSQTISASGGSGAVTLAVSGVSNPTGLTIGGSGTGTITISGTPTAAGTVTFTLTPTDARGTGPGKVYSFAVNPVVSVAPATLPDGEVGTSYVRSITPTGGTGAVTLAVSGVSNPTGLTIGGSGTGTITISGTPTAAGTVTFTVTPTDARGTGPGTTYNFTVSAPTVPPVPPGPPTTLAGSSQFAVGADAGGSATITVYNPDGSVANTFTPFPGTTGGVRTAVGDFLGNGTQDVVAGTGPGTTAEVKILDAKTGAVLFDAKPFADFTGGVFVAAGDVTGAGRADLIVTPDLSGGPRVEVFQGGDFQLVANFFGIDDPNFRGGARAAVGDINGDGYADLVISAGFGGGPRVSVYDGKSLAQGQEAHLVPDFFLFEPALRNGAYVAVGDVNGDGYADIIGGGGPGGGPRVLVISGTTLTSAGAVAALGAPVANFFAGDTSNRGGIRVAAKNLDNDKYADVLVGAGTGAGSQVTAYLGKDLAAGVVAEDLSFDALAAFAGGVFVG